MKFWSKVVKAVKVVEDGLDKLDQLEKKHLGDTDAKLDKWADEKLDPAMKKAVEKAKELKDQVLPQRKEGKQ